MPEAKIIIGKVELLLNKKIKKTIKMSAIGKYPFMKVSKEKINFGTVNLGNEINDTFEILK